MAPCRPVASRTTIHDLLAEARLSLERLEPQEAWHAMRNGALVVDTRSAEDRARQGVVPGARHVPLSILEWALDPASGHAVEDVRTDAWVVLLCAEGYSSSLAAHRLQRLGFRRATDVVGGVEGWRAAGLPLDGA
jgi:rhodanese-related sulfurtransferase